MKLVYSASLCINGSHVTVPLPEAECRKDAGKLLEYMVGQERKKGRTVIDAVSQEVFCQADKPAVVTGEMVLVGNTGQPYPGQWSDVSLEINPDFIFAQPGYQRFYQLHAL